MIVGIVSLAIAIVVVVDVGGDVVVGSCACTTVCYSCCCCRCRVLAAIFPVVVGGVAVLMLYLHLLFCTLTHSL